MNDTNLSNRDFNHWIPYIISGIGIVSSLFLWIYLTYNSWLPIIANLPWLSITTGIAFAILFTLTLHLIKLTQQRSKTLNIVKQNFNKEVLEHTQAEETTKKLEKALLQGQKLQAVGTLAGGIAHDFNNILYAIIGYVEMAREDVKNESTIYKNLGKVLEAAHRGQDLIFRILAFSRREHHDLKPLQLQSTIESVLALLRPTIPASVTIHFESLPEDFTILGDQTQLHQVIVNIINNAVDAMDGEGTVTIKIAHVHKEDDLLKQIPNRAHTHYCKIDLTDTGHGMDQTTMERIFDPFFTTKEVGKGTGLGLSTAHAIISAHQGEIMVNSKLGQGTTFTLLLPEFREYKHG